MPSDPTSVLIDQILSNWPTNRWNEFNVVVAVSGGADSVALLRALHQIKSSAAKASIGTLNVAHYDHQLRGADSDGDANFVSQFAASLELDFFCGMADANADVSSENDFREQRYAFLVAVARQTSSRYIVTAHHRDDQIETVLFRMFRGTGLAGLCGIPATRVIDESLTIVRPMLDVGREQIDAAIETWEQPFRTDVSNATSTYTRNFIRNDVLPMLRQRFTSVDDSVARLAMQSAEQRAYLREQMLPLFDSVSEADGIVEVNCEPIKDASPVLLRELFAEVFHRNAWPVSQLGFRELNRLAGLVAGPDELRFQLPGAISCQKENGTIRMDRA